MLETEGNKLGRLGQQPSVEKQDWGWQPKGFPRAVARGPTPSPGGHGTANSQGRAKATLQAMVTSMSPMCRERTPVLIRITERIRSHSVCPTNANSHHHRAKAARPQRAGAGYAGCDTEEPPIPGWGLWGLRHTDSISTSASPALGQGSHHLF